MKLSDIAKVIREMEGWMDEDARARLATQMLTKISEATLRDQGGAHLEQWTVDGGPQTFLQWCAPTVPPRTVPHSDKGYDRDGLYGFIQQWEAGKSWANAIGVNNIVRDRDREVINSVLTNLKDVLFRDESASLQEQLRFDETVEREAEKRFQELAAYAAKKGWK